MSAMVGLLYVSVGANLAALDPVTGAEVWRAKIPKGGGVASVLARDGVVYVGSAGRVHCFDGASGAVLWSSELKAMGMEPALLAAEDARTGPGGVEALAKAAADAASD